MRRLGHDRIDVLKIDVEGTEFEVIPDPWASAIPIDQLLVEIHYRFRSRSFRQGMALIDRVKATGMRCVRVSERGFEFSFEKGTLPFFERTLVDAVRAGHRRRAPISARARASGSRRESPRRGGGAP